MSLRDVCGSVGGPIEGGQEGENPAFRAGKGQEFPTCAPRGGQRESKGAKGHEGPIKTFKIVVKHQKVINFLF